MHISTLPQSLGRLFGYAPKPLESQSRILLLNYNRLVSNEGFEPSRLAALAPKASVSAVPPI